MISLQDVPLAHGIGGARDLPVSPELAIAGAVAALTVSFTVLAVAWRSPRYDDRTGEPVPSWLARAVDSGWFRGALHALGLLLTGFTGWVLWFGKDSLINPVFGMFYVLLWVGLVPASLLFGPVWRAISPFRTLTAVVARVTGGRADRGPLPYPARWGLWPAALGLYAFVWMELAFPHADELGSLRVWITAYTLLMTAGALLFGDSFLESADPFEAYSSLVARMSVWGRREGGLVFRSPLANLATTPARPGLVAVLAVLFGSTGFDSFKDSTVWIQTAQESSHPLLLTNVTLAGFCLLVGVVFVLGTVATGTHAHTRRSELPRLFAHSVVPIVVGYVVAHYLTFLVIAGQTTLIRMSDPMSDGSNLFGTADWSESYWVALHPTLLANVKVLAVVSGHVLGVIAAHDRAMHLLPRRHQLTGQLPLLFAMVGFTVGGLYLLFSA